MLLLFISYPVAELPEVSMNYQEDFLNSEGKLYHGQENDNRALWSVAYINEPYVENVNGFFIQAALVDYDVASDLDLSNNELSGAIPSEIGDLVKLYTFNLSFNFLLSIPVATDFALKSAPSCSRRVG